MMMRRTLAAVLLTGSSAWGAEVAVLKSSDVVAWRSAVDALRRAASAHNITEFDLRNDRAEADRVVGGLKGRAAVVVALGPLAAQAAREGAAEIPLVFAMIQDPGRLNLLGSAGVTGVAFSVPVKNQLAAFRMVYPRGVRVGVIYSSEASGRLVQEAQKAAPVVRLLIVERPVASEREIPEALRGMLKGDQAVDALWIPPDPILLADETRRFILSETLKAGRPVYSSIAALVTEGALVASGPDLASTGELAGELVNRLAGAERATRIEMAVPRGELVVNKKIADKMKIEIPPDALKAASKVF
jgi:putative ABC transport system substrate-binding protein